MARRFSPLDERLGLLSGGYTPQVQEAISRLGSRMSYGEAQEELQLLWGVTVSKATVCNTTMRHGHIAYELEEAAVERLAQSAAKPSASPDQLVMSTDGAMVQLTTGDWREVKLVAFGEFSGQMAAGGVKAQSQTLSYFARLSTAASFERAALLEWHKRGGENARRVVAVNDGATWIQSFIDYHCPTAIRVLDFAHAQGYLATVGKAIWGDESATFPRWFAAASKQLASQPPQRTLGSLRLLQRQHPEADCDFQIERAINYLERRRDMIDYPHFRHIQVPIGSGISESGHKVVMQRRMKQAGMRWAEHNVNPMLTLRAALCNRRWADTWHAVAQHQRRLPATSLAAPQPVAIDSTPVTAADCRRLLSLKRLAAPKAPWRDNHFIFPHRPRFARRN